MTREEAVEIIKIERECVERNTSNECDRDCINCDLLRWDEEIFSAYDMAIKALQEPERDVDRMVLLLRKCYELFSRQNESPFVLNLLEETVYYDDTECDGSCLMEDIDEVLLDNMQVNRIDTEKQE